jgi:hypothetical protein
MLYFIDNGFLHGDDAVEALGWAEDRREELKLRQAEREDAGAGARRVKLMKMMVAMVSGVKQVVLLLKIVLGALCVLCVLCVMLILKK